MRNLTSFLVGVIFALGLGLSGMTQNMVVKGFLDVFGHWDARLLGVMAGAILVHSISYRLVLKRGSPLLDTTFHIPKNKKVDGKLVLGAAIFGFGWGWAGICPGPGLVNLAGGGQNAVAFVLAMLVGMFVFKQLEKKL